MFSRRVALGALSLLSISTLALTACTSGGSQVETQAGKPMPEAVSAAIEEVVTTALEQTGSTQAMVGIWAPWAGDFVQGVTTDGSQLGVDTQFWAGQSSQAVICAALLDAVNSGEIELNRKIERDLPRQVGVDGVTYGQLCDGTSGLADYKKGLEATFTNNPTRVWLERELIASGLVRSPLSEPGKEFHKSDTNAVLLGRALSIALKQPLSNILNDRVFGPQGMRFTSFPKPTTLTVSGEALQGSVYPVVGEAIQCEAAVAVPELSNSMLSGAGGSVSTVTNMRDFYADYVAGAFESGETEGLVTKTRPFVAATKDAPASVESWGFGLMNIDPLWGNAGQITGTISAAFHDPKSGFSIVIALNNSSAGEDYVKNLALKLTSVVAETAPDGLGKLSWNEEDVTAALAAGAVCQPEPEPEAPAE